MYISIFSPFSLTENHLFKNLHSWMHRLQPPNGANRLKEVHCSFNTWGGGPSLESYSFFYEENSARLNVRVFA